MRKYTGCGFRPVGNKRMYEREVTVEKIKLDISYCWDEFEDTIFEELQNRGLRFTDLTDTLFEQIITQQVQQAIKLDTERIYHFGDKSSTDPNYDMMDGLWNVVYPGLVGQDLIPYFNTDSGNALTAGEGVTRFEIPRLGDFPLKSLDWVIWNPSIG